MANAVNNSHKKMFKAETKAFAWMSEPRLFGKTFFSSVLNRNVILENFTTLLNLSPQVQVRYNFSSYRQVTVILFQFIEITKI